MSYRMGKVPLANFGLGHLPWQTRAVINNNVGEGCLTAPGRDHGTYDQSGWMIQPTRVAKFSELSTQGERSAVWELGEATHEHIPFNVISRTRSTLLRSALILRPFQLNHLPSRSWLLRKEH